MLVYKTSTSIIEGEDGGEDKYRNFSLRYLLITLFIYSAS